jgi:hypothetical protein
MCSEVPGVPPVPPSLAERFNIRSVIGMAIYPKVDQPSLLGLHQCSDPRVWTPQEERLFQEIGRHAGAIVQEIILAPLTHDDLGQLIADSLHCKRHQVTPLAHLVHEKTAGNLFFAI